MYSISVCSSSISDVVIIGNCFSTRTYNTKVLGILKTRNLPVGITTDNNEWAHMMWPLVQSDELYLHVMLLVNAFGLGWRHGDPNMFRLDMYKKEVIRMLRDRVQSSTAGVSDGTISAVIVLASFEVSCCWKFVCSGRAFDSS